MKLLEKFLKDVSQQAKEEVLADQEKLFSIRGRLHDAAIGSIRVARKFQDPKLNTRGPKKAHATTVGSQLYVRKTMQLDNQNHQALVKSGPKSKVKTARGLPISDIVFSDPSRKEVAQWASIQGRPWQNKSSIVKIAWMTDSDFKRDGATQAIQCNEFFNEALIGHVVSETLAKDVPHCIRQHAVQIDEGHGNLILDQGGTSFERACIDMTFDECKSIFFQVLVTLLVGQKQHLKHHDMHLENIFVNRIKADETFQGKVLASQPVWSQTLGSDTLSIRHHNWLARIGDQGLSSMTDPESKTRIERIDYLDLDAAEIEWGSWNGNLEENPLQDLVTFLSKFQLEDELQFVPPNFAIQVQALFDRLQGDLGLRATSIGRPISQHFFVKRPLMSLLDLQKKQIPELFVAQDHALEIQRA